VFAMIASYVISRTLTPVLIRLLLRAEHAAGEAASSGPLMRLHARLNRGFDRFRDFYAWTLGGLLRRRVAVPTVALGLVAGAAALSIFIGTDFFPQVDAGLIRLHVRAAPRTRIERTEQLFAAIEDTIRRRIPPGDLGLVLDNIGLPARLYNLAFTDGTAIGVNDGEILISLKPGHAPTAGYVRRLREELHRNFPEAMIYFQPADMVTQILNFGVPSQIDVQVQGQDRTGNMDVARALRQRLPEVPGIVDAHIQQELDAPELHYAIDRTRAEQFGLSLADIANNINISLSSSEQVAPNFWTDPKTGIPYFLAVQTPEYRVTTMNDLNNTPISTAASAAAPVPNLLGNVASVERRGVQSVYNQSNIQPVYDVYANVQGRDLGGAARAIDKVVGQLKGQLKPGNRILVRGQIESMNSAFADLTLGLGFAAVFVYLLMVVNYQSFVDPFAVILALPGAGVGILLMLFVTGTALSVPSLMGAIMSVGVASANSILLVTFAREKRREGLSAVEAALAAGKTRLRPVLMTAAAMVVGMIPMAIGGAGEEQNAALARAVIGGLVVGTLTTLFFVPYLYSIIGRRDPKGSPAHNIPDVSGA
jgi:multidrug efflux pump subunit AcrB